MFRCFQSYAIWGSGSGVAAHSSSGMLRCFFGRAFSDVSNDLQLKEIRFFEISGTIRPKSQTARLELSR